MKRIIQVRSTERPGGNRVADAVHIAGLVVAGLGFFGGLAAAVGGSIGLMLLCWVETGVSCVLFFGCAEIIRLLQASRDRVYTLEYDDGQPEPAAPPAEAVAPPVETADAPPDQARFATRAGMPRLVCPHCGREQPSARSLCFNCGAKFIFDDET